MLATAYCPPELVGPEYFIIGTDPPSECPAHGPYAIMPGTTSSYDTVSRVPPPPPDYPSLDTAGRRRRSQPRGTSPPPTTPPATSPGAVLPGAVIPGAAPPARSPGRRAAAPRDSVRPPRDSTLPPRL